MSGASWVPQPWGRWEEKYGRRGVWDHFTLGEVGLRTISQLLSLLSPFPEGSEETPPENNGLPATCQVCVCPVSSGLSDTQGMQKTQPGIIQEHLHASTHTHTHPALARHLPRHRRALTLHLIYPPTCPRGLVDHPHPTARRGQ